MLEQLEFLPLEHAKEDRQRDGDVKERISIGSFRGTSKTLAYR